MFVSHPRLTFISNFNLPCRVFDFHIALALFPFTTLVVHRQILIHVRHWDQILIHVRHWDQNKQKTLPCIFQSPDYYISLVLPTPLFIVILRLFGT